MTLRITPFQMSDYDAAVELWRSAEGVVLARADEREAVARFLAHNDGLSFVARAEGRLAGAVLCGTDGRRGFLHHLAVDASRRRRGIGTALVERCLEALRQRGIEKCHLFVLAGNEDGQRFWERAGWSVRSDLVTMSRVIEGNAEASARGPCASGSGPGGARQPSALHGVGATCDAGTTTASDPVGRAGALFEEGLNCAEAVLAAFAERRGVSASVVRLASPFGSGMGRTNQTCGAVTGALMALGLAAGRETAADATGKERAYALAAQFCERFRAENGALACTELLGIDLGTPSGRQAALDAGVFRTRCPALVRSAARIVTELA